ncbi:TonB-dependent receptor [Thalassotalea agarivorans]|uniref:Carboxypeptidase regulatory-like domain-containing protein n=1 Tax=Thalassotalea agarivorans TaxID=349064 RepID=A0A1I0DF28_THASX|nr:TonB-dependent receptor [Thalassotalea agarivorans]SET30345.1 Carboxypeptidase regulatory-like domain-containing protein [Thalassotalea agarivorans]
MKSQAFSRVATAVVFALGMSSVAMANTTTSAIKGQVQGPNGNPAAGTTVIITHVPSGTSKTATVNESGIFTAKGLRVGGPYRVELDSDTFEDKDVNDVYLTLGETYSLNVSLESSEDIETIQVTGTALSTFASGSSPSAHFGREELETLPAINRDIKDIVRVDPRIYIDESRSDAIHCGGGNPRFNSLTLDGARMNDNFGLNSNGYPTVRVPFSFDSIEQVSVELAPYDVNYGSFTACNINAVSKSGTNEVHGGFFYDYTNDSMKGDSVNGEDIDLGSFSEKRYGFNVGFPILKDKVFGFVSYEKLEGVQIFSYGPFGNDVSQADLDRVLTASQDVYGYDAGGMPGSMPVEDEKFLVKLDWNINDSHRVDFVYNYNDGFELSQSDADGDELSLDSHFYERGAKLTSMVAALYSDWTDNFSTSISIGKMKLDNRQISLDAASGFGEVQIDQGGSTIYLGPDDSRQSNKLYWDNKTFKFSGNYYLEDHTLTFGYEYESLTAFNLFMQHTQGEFRFDSIEDFENGHADRIYYNNSAGTNIPEDASQEFTYDVHTFFIQDEYTFTDIDATLMFGVRYDMYTSSDQPRYNQNFFDRYGFANNSTFDGVSLLQPRVGFNWAVNDNLNVRAGFGLYSGGNPNVWLSNSYSNDGLVQIGLREFNVNLVQTPDGKVDLFANQWTDPGTPIFGIPQAMYDEIASIPEAGGDGSVNAVDPNFEVPSEWKYSIGATYITDDGYSFTADILMNRRVDSAMIRDAGIQYSGDTAPDGRPLFESPLGRTGDFVLTNSDKDGKSTIVSFGMNKEWDFGLNATFGYSYTTSEDANPMTSSVAGSNYSNFATIDPSAPSIATSDYEVPHRLTMVLSYSVNLISNLDTTVSLFGQSSAGRPYSYTFSRSDRAFGDSNWNGSRQLLYVPTENDPNVVYDPGFDQAAFNAFIAEEGLARGGIQKRNDHYSDWWTTFDLKLNQELPGFMDGHKSNVYLTIKNIGNMLNDEWGVLTKGAFVGNRMVGASINDQGQYVFESFNDGNQELTVERDTSLWEMRVGIKYDF